MNKKILIGGLVLLVIIIGLVFLRSEKLPGSVVDVEGVTIYRVHMDEEVTSRGYLHIPYSTEVPEVPFVYVGVDLNSDGQLASYETESGRQEEWLVVDMRANVSSDHANRYSFTIIDPYFETKLPAQATAVFTSESLDGDTTNGFTIPEKGVVNETFTISDLRIDNIGVKFSPDPTGLNDVGPGGGILALRPETAYADDGSNHTGFGTEYGTYPDPSTVPSRFNAEAKGMPDLDQAYNECAPTAIANSFRWLAKTHGFENRIPESDQALIDEIKGYTEWSQTGVKPGNSLKGKQEFIKARGLPIEAHIIADEKNPQWMFYKIYQEMAKGQAVELSIQFWDENGRPDGAHLVTVQEVYRAEDGRQWITLNDPGTDARTDRSSGDVYRFDNNGNTIKDYLSSGRTTVRYAIAQSPIPSVMDETWVDPWSDSTVLIGTDVNLREGSEISLGISQWRFFNVTVNDPGDHMVGDTFDISARIVKRDNDKMRVTVGTSSYEFQVEDPWNLNGTFKSSKNLTVTPQANKPPQTSVASKQYTVTTQFTCTEPGIAHVTYTANIGWNQTGGDIPKRISKYYADQLKPNDTVEVQSPPFRCIGEVTEEQQEESRIASLTTCGIVQDPNGVEIEALVLDKKCYPKSQFRSAGPDRCDSDHWHGGKVYSLDGAEKDDPAADGCGFGKVKDVEVRKVKIDQQTASRFLGSIFEDTPIPEERPIEYEYDLGKYGDEYWGGSYSDIQVEYTIEGE